MPLTITIFGWEKCPACVKAKELLRSCRLQYKDVDIQVDPSMQPVVQNLIGADKRLTVPQIFFHNTHIGGFNELQAIVSNRQLPEVLQRAASSRPLRPELGGPRAGQEGGARPHGQGHEGGKHHHRPHHNQQQHPPQQKPQPAQQPQAAPQAQPQQCAGGVCPMPQARPQPQCVGGVCAMPPRQAQAQAGKCG